MTPVVEEEMEPEPYPPNLERGVRLQICIILYPGLVFLLTRSLTLNTKILLGI